MKMLKKKVRKKLPSSYNYYEEVKIKSDKIALEYNITDEFNKSRLYNLILNLCNQIVYNYTYVLTKADLFFIADYNINILVVLDNFRDDIIKQKAYAQSINFKLMHKIIVSTFKVRFFLVLYIVYRIIFIITME